jgi:hypothetical protein
MMRAGRSYLEQRLGHLTQAQLDDGLGFLSRAFLPNLPRE